MVGVGLGAGKVVTGAQSWRRRGQSGSAQRWLWTQERASAGLHGGARLTCLRGTRRSA